MADCHVVTPLAPPLSGMAKRIAAILAHRFTPETSRKYRSKALAARLRNQALRHLDRAMANTKCARLPITGRHVVRLLSEALARVARLEGALVELKGITARQDRIEEALRKRRHGKKRAEAGEPPSLPPLPDEFEPIEPVGRAKPRPAARVASPDQPAPPVARVALQAPVPLALTAPAPAKEPQPVPEKKHARAAAQANAGGTPNLQPGPSAYMRGFRTQPGEIVHYGYEQSPGGPWLEAKPPAPPATGRTAAAEAVARARQAPRRR